MTSRILFNLKGKLQTDVKFNNADKKIVEIALANGTPAYADVQREGDHQALEGKQADGTTNGTANSLRIDGTYTNNIPIANLRNVNITCSDEEEAIELLTLLQIKDQTKAMAGGGRDN